MRRKKILLSNLDIVISDIKDFQRNEGVEMLKDIELRLNLIDSHLKNVVELEPKRIENERKAFGFQYKVSRLKLMLTDLSKK